MLTVALISQASVLSLKQMIGCSQLALSCNDTYVFVFQDTSVLFDQKMLDGDQCSTLRMLLAGHAESVQLLQGRCQQIGHLLQEAAAAPAHAAGCVTLHRKVGISAYSSLP